MDRTEIDAVLTACEERLAAGNEVPLGELGFWRAVRAVKRDPQLATEFADRMAVIDREALLRWAFLAVPGAIGTALAVLGTLGGLAVVAAGYYVDDPAAGLLILAGTGLLLVATHSLTHVVVGRALGMRFTHWFIGTLRRPQPGVKVDYATYLRVPARNRAWMHASGALMTKAIPFIQLGAAWGSGAAWWTYAVLLALGVGQIATDVLWSTSSSDWKKYSREMAIARQA